MRVIEKGLGKRGFDSCVQLASVDTRHMGFSAKISIDQQLKL